MKKNLQREIDALKYRIQRYQSVGNGSMCQTLFGQLRALQAGLPK